MFRGRRAFTQAVAVVGLIGLGTVSRADQDPPLFSARSELVLLHVTATDSRGRYLSGLPREVFTVADNGVNQPIRFFLAEDAPATIGLLIDTSGSMQPNRSHVIAAARAFVATSHPRDDVFALTFNNTIRAVLPAESPFTSDADTLGTALEQGIAPRGPSAVHDAIASAFEYLERGRYDRKVLVLVSDGADNASRLDYASIRERVEASNVVMYAVGLVDPLDSNTGQKRLKQLAAVTGGQAFFPKNARQVSEALQHVAMDIRHAYLLAVEPAASAGDGLHRLTVAVRPGDGRKALVRTRSAYRLDSNEPVERPHGE